MKLLFVEPYFLTAFYFRRQLIKRLAQNNEVFLVIDQDKDHYFSSIEHVHVLIVRCNLGDRSLISNFRLLRNYKRILKQVNPQVILSFTIKPNLFLPLVKGKEMRIIANITGLGRSFQKKGLLNFVVVSLYKKAFSKVDFVFFQNEEIRDVFAKLRIPVKSSEVIPGSGVDASYFF